jgi:N-acetylmuramoyl-L-alanine amidase
MPKEDHVEREATDQPPPIHDPFTRAQIISLVVPAVSFLALIGLLAWGLLTTGAGPSAPPALTPTAAPALTPTAAPGTATPAPSASASPTAPVAGVTATSRLLALDAASATMEAEPSAPAAAALDVSPTAGAARTAPAATPSTAPATAIGAAPAATPPAGLPLQGRRIALDPGHGPRDDLGAVLVDPDSGRLILSEDELNLAVALLCRDLLRARGAIVTLTRETKDSFTAPWPPDTNGDGIKNGQSDDLQERIDIMNAAHAEVFVSIHANSSANPAKRQGIQALYCAAADCLFPTQGRHLGSLLLDQLELKLAAVGDPVQARELRDDLWSDGPDDPMQHLFLIGPADGNHHPRAAQMPGVIVESLYVTSPAEAALLKQDAVRRAIALAYADGLQAFLTGAAP